MGLHIGISYKSGFSVKTYKNVCLRIIVYSRKQNKYVRLIRGEIRENKLDF